MVPRLTICMGTVHQVKGLWSRPASAHFPRGGLSIRARTARLSPTPLMWVRATDVTSIGCPGAKSVNPRAFGALQQNDYSEPLRPSSRRGVRPSPQPNVRRENFTDFGSVRMLCVWTRQASIYTYHRPFLDQFELVFHPAVHHDQDFVLRWGGTLMRSFFCCVRAQ